MVATIKADTPDILRFAAYHIEAGAHRIYIYLDAATPQAFAALKAHPKVRVQLRDVAWWDKRPRKRPEKHQARQGVNATHAYRREAEVDWLAHIDVDEFLVSDRPISDLLGEMPDDIDVIRVRPMELLTGGDGTAYKAFMPSGPDRKNVMRDIYPAYGDYLRQGFLSHSGGKVLLRTGLSDITLRIHKAFRDGEEITRQTTLPGLTLAHHHATSWEDWLGHFKFRLTKGSYRADLDPFRDPSRGQMSLNQLFEALMDQGGETALRGFYDAVVADTPDLRARLDAHGLLTCVDLQLDRCMLRHFPGSV